jgi:hypothetical protein
MHHGTADTLWDDDHNSTNAPGAPEPSDLPLPIDQVGTIGDDIRIPRPVVSHALQGRLPNALLIALFATALSLAMAGGSQLLNFGPTKTTKDHKADCSHQTADSGEPGCVGAKSNRDAAHNAPAFRTDIPVAADRHEPVNLISAQGASAKNNNTSQAKQPPSSSAPQAAAVQPERTLPKLVAVAETKPSTIDGWTVRDVVGGIATLEGPNGILKATAGDAVLGLGKVESIVRWGNRWIVATSRGLISTP